MTREIKITIDIDETTHEGKSHMTITEDGKPKELWTFAQILTTSRFARNLLCEWEEEAIIKIIE